MNKKTEGNKKGGNNYILLNIVGYVYLCLKVFNFKNYPAITATIVLIFLQMGK